MPSVSHRNLNMFSNIESERNRDTKLSLGQSCPNLFSAFFQSWFIAWTSVTVSLPLGFTFAPAVNGVTSATPLFPYVALSALLMGALIDLLLARAIKERPRTSKALCRAVPILFGLSVLLPITIGEVAAQRLIPMQYLLFTPFSREALSSCRDRVNIALTILCALFCFFVPVAPPVIMGFLALAVSIQPIFEARRRRQSPQDNRRPSISQRICSDSRPGSRIQPASFALIAALLSCASQSVAFLSFGDGTTSINWNSSVEAPFTTVLIAAIPVAALLRSRPNGTIISLSLILATVLSVLEGPVGTHALLFCLLSLSIASAVELRYWRQSHPGHLAIVCALASCACLLFETINPSAANWPIYPSILLFLACYIDVAPFLANLIYMGKNVILHAVHLCPRFKEPLAENRSDYSENDALANYLASFRLTEREQNVLLDHIKGLSFAAVAEQMGISKSTASTYYSRAANKLGSEGVGRVKAMMLEQSNQSIADREARPFAPNSEALPCALAIARIALSALSTFLVLLPILPLHIARDPQMIDPDLATLSVVCLGIAGPQIIDTKSTQRALSVSPSLPGCQAVIAALVFLFVTPTTHLGSLIMIAARLCLCYFGASSLCKAVPPATSNIIPAALSSFALCAGAILTYALSPLFAKALALVAVVFIIVLRAAISTYGHLPDKPDASVSTPKADGLIVLAIGSGLLGVLTESSSQLAVAHLAVTTCAAVIACSSLATICSTQASCNQKQLLATCLSCLCSGLFFGEMAEQLQPIPRSVAFLSAPIACGGAFACIIGGFYLIKRSIDRRCAIMDKDPDVLGAMLRNKGLTQSEARIILSYASGATARSIAQELFVETSTVRTHIKHAYNKLDVHNRDELERAITSLLEESIPSA